MFYLRIYDNYHYGDESEAYNHGRYATYEEAITGAKAIVDEFMEFNWRENMTPEDLRVLFSMFGEDPAIVPDEHGENKRFSAYDYADESAEQTCKKLQKTPYPPGSHTPIIHDFNTPSGSGNL